MGTPRGHATIGLVLDRTTTLVAPLVVVAISTVSLVVVFLNEPGPLQVAGMAVVATAAGAGLLLRRSERLWSVVAAAGGGVAVAMTNGEYFSFWPAAAALLTLSAAVETRRRGRPTPLLAPAAGVLGVLLAQLVPEPRPTAALLPVAVAAALIVLLGPLRALTGAVRELDTRARESERRARISDSRRRELQHRTDLARELHDSLGHHVSAMVVQAEAGQVRDPENALVAIADLGRQALTELDAVLFDLRDSSETAAPAVPREPVDLRQVDSLLASPLRASGVEVRVAVTTSADAPDTLAAAYRIVQEALTNVMRHADARQVTVRIEDQDDDVVVEVEDDGVGLPDQLRPRNGLRGIVERAQGLGGDVSVERGPRRGTVVRVRIPRSAP